jgi:hypothetical protein
MTNRVDTITGSLGASLATPSDAGSNWVQSIGSWSLDASTGTSVAANSVANAHAVLESSTTDVEVVASMQVGAGANGVLVRQVDSANFYYCLVRSDNTPRIFKFVDSVITQISSESTGNTSSGTHDVKLTVEGTNPVSLVLYVDDVQKATASDSTVLFAGTKHGLYSSSNTLLFYNFSITDLDEGEAQLLSPIQDISAGTWLPSSGSPAELWQMIDGEKSPDTDYDYTTAAGTMEVKFASGSTPSLQSGHTLRYRLRGNGTCDALVKLKCGSTVIAQWTETNVPAVDTDYSHTLDSSPSFTISDYTDLRISVEAVP